MERQVARDGVEVVVDTRDRRDPVEQDERRTRRHALEHQDIGRSVRASGTNRERGSRDERDQTERNADSVQVGSLAHLDRIRGRIERPVEVGERAELLLIDSVPPVLATDVDAQFAGPRDLGQLTLGQPIQSGTLVERVPRVSVRKRAVVGRIELVLDVAEQRVHVLHESVGLILEIGVRIVVRDERLVRNVLEVRAEVTTRQHGLREVVGTHRRHAVVLERNL